MKIAPRVAFSVAMLFATAMVMAGLAGTIWWTGQTVHAGVALSSTRTLWQISSEDFVSGNVSHGGACASSDDCLASAWCRTGDGKCWTDDDCALASRQESPDEFCARLPRSKVLQSSGSCSKKDSEGSDSERAACNRVHAVRAVAIAAVPFALSAVALAWLPCEHAGLVFCSALVATGCELVAVWIAIGVEIADGQLVGQGFIFHCCGTSASALGAAAALRWAWSSRRAGRSARQLDRDLELQSESSDEVARPTDQPELDATAARTRELNQPPDKPEIDATAGPVRETKRIEFPRQVNDEKGFVSDGQVEVGI